jgi:glycosyltransferase involved in cell wall biosynthesis
MEISYAITVCNELEEIKRLLPFLLKNKRENDEVVVLFDLTNGTEEVKKYLLQTSEVQATFDWFKGNFSEWKNKLNLLCNGDYIFQLDADEMISEEFMELLPTIIENNSEVEFYWVPRENYVLGLTSKHIQEWGWRVDVQNRVNYPDYQGRIYKKSSEIKWKNKVHEVLVGYKHYTSLPEVPALSINHTKTIEKQEKQNNYYSTL